LPGRKLRDAIIPFLRIDGGYGFYATHLEGRHTEKQRQALQMRYQYGWKMNNIALQLGRFAERRFKIGSAGVRENRIGQETVFSYARIARGRRGYYLSQDFEQY
jgi:hypothetical protein